MSLRTTRIASAASLLLAAALTLSACSTAAPAEQEKASAANTVTITDNHGEVEVPVTPARVVALDNTVLDTLSDWDVELNLPGVEAPRPEKQRRRDEDGLRRDPAKLGAG